MFLKLQILFAILSAVCVAVAIPVGVALGFMGAVICAALAFICYLVMLTFKLKHESLNPTDKLEENGSDDVQETALEQTEVEGGGLNEGKEE